MKVMKERKKEEEVNSHRRTVTEGKREVPAGFSSISQKPTIVSTLSEGRGKRRGKGSVRALRLVLLPLAAADGKAKKKKKGKKG